MKSRLAALAFALATLFAAPAFAEPLQLAAQGRLTSNGGPVADGTYAMGLALYDAPTGGKPLFLETFLAVPVQGGVFAITLGAAQVVLDSAVMATGKLLWVGVVVGGDPELPRVQLLRVPSAVHALVAAQAQDVQCSGCVGSEDLAKASVTGEKIASGAVGSNHVNFNWAASDQPGGPATFAVAANTAKLADAASFADDAGSAAKAKALECTGCVKAPMLADSVAADLVAAGKLAKVATSGKYADLQGGPDLSGVGTLAGNNDWKGGQSWLGALNFNKQQAQLFRFQNADKEPTTCDASAVGVTYYNTATQALVVCNGKLWQTFAKVATPGSNQSNPGASCLALATSGDQPNDGIYWIKPPAASAAFQVYCDQKNGGWALLLKTSSKSAWGYNAPVWTAADDLNGSVPKGDVDADAVSRAFYTLSIVSTRACIAKYDGGAYACETLQHAASTARNLANAAPLASTQGTNNLLTPTWKSIVAGGVWGAMTWHRFGWNTGTSSHGGARFGFTADNDSSDSQDSGIGFGLFKNNAPSIDAGAGYYQYPWTPAPNPPTAILQGQIWGR
ncbi:MAG: hypothetical protein FJ100_22370 [Deltaproteobacteria bacterium]|nr:hypothetical protein [Deltaproteobacteria bacterium]